jgi:hypothetical protein
MAPINPAKSAPPAATRIIKIQLSGLLFPPVDLAISVGVTVGFGVGVDIVVGVGVGVTVDAMKSALIRRALSIIMLIEMLSAVLASMSPDHFSNWYPVEGTAVNTTTVPLVYVPAAHSGGSYVNVPP